MIQSSTRLRRAKDVINANLDRQLMSYTIAASAACFGIIAGPSADAKVVYTPASVSIADNVLSIDLNNDGVPDFEIVEFLCGSRTGCAFANPLVTGNGIKGSRLGAFAGAYGLPVGPQGQFLTQLVRVTSTASGAAFMAAAGAYGGSGFSNGPWAHTTNKYLGLKFSISGKTHYGWARLSVDLFKNPSITLTGYAYETIPNHTIIEGRTQGTLADRVAPVDLLAPTKQGGSLGMLARGADGLAIWRREDEVASLA